MYTPASITLIKHGFIVQWCLTWNWPYGKDGYGSSHSKSSPNSSVSLFHVFPFLDGLYTSQWWVPVVISSRGHVVGTSNSSSCRDVLESFWFIERLADCHWCRHVSKNMVWTAEKDMIWRLYSTDLLKMVRVCARAPKKDGKAMSTCWYVLYVYPMFIPCLSHVYPMFIPCVDCFSFGDVFATCCPATSSSHHQNDQHLQRWEPRGETKMSNAAVPSGKRLNIAMDYGNSPSLMGFL